MARLTGQAHAINNRNSEELCTQLISVIYNVVSRLSPMPSAPVSYPVECRASYLGSLPRVRLDPTHILPTMCEAAHVVFGTQICANPMCHVRILSPALRPLLGAGR